MITKFLLLTRKSGKIRMLVRMMNKKRMLQETRQES